MARGQTTFKVDEAAQLRSVEDALLRKFEGRFGRDEICAEVQRTQSGFSSARVRTFVPVLIQRAVSESLRRQQ